MRYTSSLICIFNSNQKSLADWPDPTVLERWWLGIGPPIKVAESYPVIVQIEYPFWGLSDSKLASKKRRNKRKTALTCVSLTSTELLLLLLSADDGRIQLEKCTRFDCTSNKHRRRYTEQWCHVKKPSSSCYPSCYYWQLETMNPCRR